MKLCISRQFRDTTPFKKFIHQHINDIALAFKEVRSIFIKDNVLFEVADTIIDKDTINANIG